MVHGTRLAINMHTTEYQSFEEDLDIYESYGIRSIGLVREKLELHGIENGIEMLANRGFRVSEFHVLDFLSRGDGEEQLNYARDTIDLAARLHTKVCVIAGPWQGGDRREELGRCIVCLRNILPYAEEKGVVLGLEPLGPMFTSIDLLGTLRQASDIVEEIASPSLGIVIDLHHVWWDPHVFHEIRRARDTISAVHLNDVVVDLSTESDASGHGKWDSDGNRVDIHTYAIPGNGMLTLRDFVNCLENEGNFTGEYQVEIWQKRLWDLGGREILRQVVTGLDSLSADLPWLRPGSEEA